MWRKTIDFGVYLFVRVLIAVVQALPLSACEKVAELLATLFGRVLRIRGHVVDENLRIAFPSITAEERDAITWQMWRHLFLMMAEIAHTPRKVHETNWKEHSHIVNQELFVRTLLCRPAARVDLRPLRQLRAGRLPDGPVRLSDVHGRPRAR